MLLASASLASSSTGTSSQRPTTDLWEPDDGRLSRRVLRAPGGATPPGYSPGEGVGDQRFRQSISFAVRSNATARASWASRWIVLRSVFRLIWPKFDSHEFVRSTGQRRPIGRFFAPSV